MNRSRILYVEDEPYLARIVRDTLELKGYEVLHLKDGRDIVEELQTFRPDICLLDVMLPHVDGFTLGGLIRNLQPKLPIIFLTAKTQTQDVLDGFSSGGNDYIRKPFSMEELMVRIDNLLRLATRTETDASEEEILLGAWRFYPARFELVRGEAFIRLSHRESQVLGLLCRHRNQTLERKLLLQLVWGDDSFFNSRNLDVYIRKLREYLKDEPSVEIITLKGVGYFFRVDSSLLSG